MRNEIFFVVMDDSMETVDAITEFPKLTFGGLRGVRGSIAYLSLGSPLF